MKRLLGLLIPGLAAFLLVPNLWDTRCSATSAWRSCSPAVERARASRSTTAKGTKYYKDEELNW